MRIRKPCAVKTVTMRRTQYRLVGVCKQCFDSEPDKSKLPAYDGTRSRLVEITDCLYMWQYGCYLCKNLTMGAFEDTSQTYESKSEHFEYNETEVYLNSVEEFNQSVKLLRNE